MLRFLNARTPEETKSAGRQLMPRMTTTDEERRETNMPTTIVEVSDILKDAERLPMEFEDFVREQARRIGEYVNDDDDHLAFQSAHHLKLVVRKRDFKAETRDELQWA